MKQERAAHEEKLAQLNKELESARLKNLEEIQLVQQQAADNIFETRQNATEQITTIKAETQKEIADFKKQISDSKAEVSKVDLELEKKKKELEELNKAIEAKKKELGSSN